MTYQSGLLYLRDSEDRAHYLGRRCGRLRHPVDRCRGSVVSDSGSGLGAEIPGKVRSDAVKSTDTPSLTCSYASGQGRTTVLTSEGSLVRTQLCPQMVGLVVPAESAGTTICHLCGLLALAYNDY